MSEETEDNKEELFFYEGGELLRNNRYSTYSRTSADIQAYLALKKEIEDKMAAGEDVYVQIMDERRKGAVGKIKAITFNHIPENRARYSYYNNGDYLGISDIEVVWDGRKNKVKPEAYEVEILRNWDQGTIWAWTQTVKSPEEKVIAYDHLGQEIEAGQFVCFVHRKYGNISMKFGTVTRITPKGGVFVKTLKLRDGERGGEELRAFDMDDLVICNDKLMGRLMMARLSAD